MIKDLLLLRSSNLIPPLESLLSVLGSPQLINFYKLVSELVTKWEDKVLLFGLPSMKGPNVGQLSCKEEAAGKVRVFAMVDVWTQSVLKPLHDTLFSYLKSLPNDGTFDQFASVKRAMKKAEISNCSFGYDLSAATDRLPLVIQKVILEELFSKEFSDN